MTEAEWFACPAPVPMLESLLTKGTPPEVIHSVARHVLRRYFPHEPPELIPAHLIDNDWLWNYRIYVQQLILAPEPLGHFVERIGDAYAGLGTSAEPQRDADLVREIVGNPFRAAEIRPEWLTSDVHMLAEGIRYDRAFDRLPILADALQDAGCNDESILDHCRQTDAPHHLACWVLELISNPHKGVPVEALQPGLRYKIARVNGQPGYTETIFLGRDAEGGMYRFALCASQEVIALHKREIEPRVALT